MIMAIIMAIIMVSPRVLGIPDSSSFRDVGGCVQLRQEWFLARQKFGGAVVGASGASGDQLAPVRVKPKCL